MYAIHRQAVLVYLRSDLRGLDLTVKLFTAMWGRITGCHTYVAFVEGFNNHGKGNGLTVKLFTAMDLTVKLFTATWGRIKWLP